MNPLVPLLPLLSLFTIVVSQTSTLSQLSTDAEAKPTAVFLVDPELLLDDVLKSNSPNFTGTIEVVRYYMSDNTTFSGSVELENVFYKEANQAVVALVNQAEKNKIPGSLYAYFRYKPQQSENDTLKVVVKRGTESGLGLSMLTASNLVSDAIGSHWATIKDDKERTEYGTSLPVWNTWKPTSAYAYFTTCAIEKKGNTTTTNALMKWGLRWADDAFNSYGSGKDFTVGYSHSAYRLCVKIARKTMFRTHQDTVDAAKALSCPSGYCDGSIAHVINHDEL